MNVLKLTGFVIVLSLLSHGGCTGGCGANPSRIWVQLESPLTGWYFRSTRNHYERTFDGDTMTLARVAHNDTHFDYHLYAKLNGSSELYYQNVTEDDLFCPGNSEPCPCIKLKVTGLDGYEGYYVRKTNKTNDTVSNHYNYTDAPTWYQDIENEENTVRNYHDLAPNLELNMNYDQVSSFTAHEGNFLPRVSNDNGHEGRNFRFHTQQNSDVNPYSSGAYNVPLKIPKTQRKRSLRFYERENHTTKHQVKPNYARKPTKSFEQNYIALASPINYKYDHKKVKLYPQKVEIAENKAVLPKKTFDDSPVVKDLQRQKVALKFPGMENNYNKNAPLETSLPELNQLKFPQLQNPLSVNNVFDTSRIPPQSHQNDDDFLPKICWDEMLGSWILSSSGIVKALTYDSSMCPNLEPSASSWYLTTFGKNYTQTHNGYENPTPINMISNDTAASNDTVQNDSPIVSASSTTTEFSATTVASQVTEEPIFLDTINLVEYDLNETRYRNDEEHYLFKAKNFKIECAD